MVMSLKLASVFFFFLPQVVSLYELHTHIWLCVVFYICPSSYFFVFSLNVCVFVGGSHSLPISRHHLLSSSFSIIYVFAYKLTSFYVYHESTFLHAYMSVFFFCPGSMTHCLLLSLSLPLISLPLISFFIFSRSCHSVSPFFILHCSFYTLCAGI